MMSITSTLRSSTLLLFLSLLFLSTTTLPSPGGYGGPTYTWSNPPPTGGSKGGNNNGNQITNFSFAKWVDEVQKGKGMTPEEALASYKASERAKREARRLAGIDDDDDDDEDELPPWYFTHGPGGNNTTTGAGRKRASEPDGPTCYWHKNERPEVEDAFTVVSMMAYHPELINNRKDEGGNITRPSNTASLNVRSITGLRYGVLGTDIARAGGLIMDYCTWKGRSGGGEYAWENGYLYVTIEHTGRGEKTMQENLMDKRGELIGPRKAGEKEDEVEPKW